MASQYLPENIRIEPAAIEPRAESVFSAASTQKSSSGRTRRSKGGKNQQQQQQATTVANDADQSKYILNKKLTKNEYMSMIVRYQSWRDQLRNELAKERAKLASDDNASTITITPMEKSTETMPRKDWLIKMNRILTDYCNRFKKVKIDYFSSTRPHIEELKSRIDPAMIQFIDDAANCKLYLMGKPQQFDEFFNRNEKFKSMLEASQPQPPIVAASCSAQQLAKAPPNRKEKKAKPAPTPTPPPQPAVVKTFAPPLAETSNQMHSRQETLPRFIYTSNKRLVQMLLDYLKKKFELSSYIIDQDNGKVDLIGASAKVIQAAMVFNNSLGRIKTKNIVDKLDLNLLKSKRLESILLDCLKNLELIFVFKVMNIRQLFLIFHYCINKQILKTLFLL